MPPARSISLACCLALLFVGGAGAWSADDSLVVIVLSDLNSAYGTIGYHENVVDGVRDVVAMQPDLVLVTGDVVAGQRPNLLPEARLRKMWDAYESSVMQPLRDAGIPVAMTPGNHDASAYPAFAGERALYGKRWEAAGDALDIVDAGRFPFHYAFQMGNTLFVSLDVTTTGAIPDAQFAWLEDVLARARGRYEHRVVFSHVPIWPFASGREREATRDARLHGLLADAGVDLYLSGHHHAFYPGYHDGVAYVSQACLGAGPRRLLGTPSTSARGYSLLRIERSTIRVAGIAARNPGALVPWSSLPEGVGAGSERLLRADIAEAGIVELQER